MISAGSSRALTLSRGATSILAPSPRSLMAVGFGDAGAEIIADNMRSGGDLNPMVPGQKVKLIVYGARRS